MGGRGWEQVEAWGEKGKSQGGGQGLSSGCQGRPATCFPGLLGDLGQDSGGSEVGLHVRWALLSLE